MKIQYAGWTDAAPQNLSQKDAQKLAKQLKTYVNSTKFVRNGSKIDKLDKDGILVKTPVKNVKYYTDAQGSQPMTAKQLDDYIRTAIITKDPQMLQRASLYRFYKSTPIKTQKQKTIQSMAKYRKRLGRNAAIWSTVLGVAGAALPIADRLTLKASIDKKTLQSATLLAIAGIGSGMAIAGLTTER